MTRERDEDSGRWVETFSLDEFLDALESLPEPAGTKEVAEEVGCVQRTAYDKLRELEDQGKVTSRTIGTARMWKRSTSEADGSTSNRDRFHVGDRVRVDISDESDPGFEEYRGEPGTVAYVLEEDDDSIAGNDEDSVLYTVELDSGGLIDLHGRDLRPP